MMAKLFDSFLLFLVLVSLAFADPTSTKEVGSVESSLGPFPLMGPTPDFMLGGDWMGTLCYPGSAYRLVDIFGDFVFFQDEEQKTQIVSLQSGACVYWDYSIVTSSSFWVTAYDQTSWTLVHKNGSDQSNKGIVALLQHGSLELFKEISFPDISPNAEVSIAAISPADFIIKESLTSLVHVVAENEGVLDEDLDASQYLKISDEIAKLINYKVTSFGLPNGSQLRQVISTSHGTYGFLVQRDSGVVSFGEFTPKDNNVQLFDLPLGLEFDRLVEGKEGSFILVTLAEFSQLAVLSIEADEKKISASLKIASLNLSAEDDFDLITCVDSVMVRFGHHLAVLDQSSLELNSTFRLNYLYDMPIEVTGMYCKNDWESLDFYFGIRTEYFDAILNWDDMSVDDGLFVKKAALTPGMSHETFRLSGRDVDFNEIFDERKDSQVLKAKDYPQYPFEFPQTLKSMPDAYLKFPRQLEPIPYGSIQANKASTIDVTSDLFDSPKNSSWEFVTPTDHQSSSGMLLGQDHGLAWVLNDVEPFAGTVYPEIAYSYKSVTVVSQFPWYVYPQPENTHITALLCDYSTEKQACVGRAMIHDMQVLPGLAIKAATGSEFNPHVHFTSVHPNEVSSLSHSRALLSINYGTVKNIFVDKFAPFGFLIVEEEMIHYVADDTEFKDVSFSLPIDQRCDYAFFTPTDIWCIDAVTIEVLTIVRQPFSSTWHSSVALPGSSILIDAKQMLSTNKAAFLTRYHLKDGRPISHVGVLDLQSQSTIGMFAMKQSPASYNQVVPASTGNTWIVGPVDSEIDEQIFVITIVEDTSSTLPLPYSSYSLTFPNAYQRSSLYLESDGKTVYGIFDKYVFAMDASDASLLWARMLLKPAPLSCGSFEHLRVSQEGVVVTLSCTTTSSLISEVTTSYVLSLNTSGLVTEKNTLFTFEDETTAVEVSEFKEEVILMGEVESIVAGFRFGYHNAQNKTSLEWQEEEVVHMISSDFPKTDSATLKASKVTETSTLLQDPQISFGVEDFGVDPQVCHFSRSDLISPVLSLSYVVEVDHREVGITIISDGVEQISLGKSSGIFILCDGLLAYEADIVISIEESASVVFPESNFLNQVLSQLRHEFLVY